MSGLISKNIIRVGVTYSVDKDFCQRSLREELHLFCANFSRLWFTASPREWIQANIKEMCVNESWRKGFLQGRVKRRREWNNILDSCLSESRSLSFRKDIQHQPEEQMCDECNVMLNQISCIAVFVSFVQFYKNIFRSFCLPKVLQWCWISFKSVKIAGIPE